MLVTSPVLVDDCLLCWCSTFARLVLVDDPCRSRCWSTPAGRGRARTCPKWRGRTSRSRSSDARCVELSMSMIDIAAGALPPVVGGGGRGREPRCRRRRTAEEAAEEPAAETAAEAAAAADHHRLPPPPPPHRRGRGSGRQTGTIASGAAHGAISLFARSMRSSIRVAGCTSQGPLERSRGGTLSVFGPLRSAPLMSTSSPVARLAQSLVRRDIG